MALYFDSGERVARTVQEAQNNHCRLLRLFFRSLLVLCFLSFLISSVALSIGPAHPYVKGRSRTSHLSKISRTIEAGIEGASEFPPADRPLGTLEKRPVSAFFISLEIPFPKVPRLLSFYHFRPPPLP